MKSLKLIFSFYSQNKIPAIILILVYTVSLFTATFFIGQYRYITYGKELLDNYKNKNMALCMLMDNNTLDVIQSDSDYMMNVISDIEKQAKSYKAYDDIIKIPTFTGYYNGLSVTSLIYSDSLLQQKDIKLSEGNWFSKSSQNDDYYEVILSGMEYEEIKVGEILDIDLRDSNTNKKCGSIKVKVAGKLGIPYMTCNFTLAGTNANSKFIFNSFNGMIFKDDKALTDMLKEKNVETLTQSSFIAEINPNATEKEKQDYFNFLGKYGIVSAYEEIKNNTESVVSQAVRNKIPLPCFFVGIVTISLISISVLLVNKKFNQYAVYQLCGCSRRKSLIYMFCGISLLAFIGGAVNVAFCKLYPTLSYNGIINFGEVVIDDVTILIIILYTLFSIVLACVIPYAIFRKNSPIEVYRRYSS